MRKLKVKLLARFLQGIYLINYVNKIYSVCHDKNSKNGRL